MDGKPPKNPGEEGEEGKEEKDLVAELGVDSLKNNRDKGDDIEAPSAEDAVESVSEALDIPKNEKFFDYGGVDVPDETMVRLETFALGIDAVERHIGHEMAESVREDLRRIDSITPNTVVELRRNEKLDPITDGNTRQLLVYGVNADHLTPSETQAVLDYANSATPEMMDAKVDKIYDAIEKHIEGKSTRRDGRNPAFFNEEEYERKQSLQDRYQEYKDGKLDSERGFNVEQTYRKLVHKNSQHEKLDYLTREIGEDDLSDYRDEDSGESEYLRRLLEEEDLDVLMDHGLVDPDDCYAYGPFTWHDLQDIEGDLSKSYTSITNHRFNGDAKRVGKTRIRVKSELGEVQPGMVIHSGASLASLMGEVIPTTAKDLEQDLIHGFIADEILQNRRLNSKNTLATSAALALDVIDLEEPIGDEAKKLAFEEARRAVSYLAKYSAEMFGYSSAEMKNRFGSSRPISKEYFEEIAKKAASLEEPRAEFFDRHFKQTLTKIDEHMCDVIYSLDALQQTEEDLD